MRFYVVSALAVVLSTATVVGQAAQPQARPADQSSAATESSVARDSRVQKGTRTADDTIKCRYVQGVNSRIPSRICMTKAEWDEEERKLRERVRSNRNRSGTCASEGPC